MTEKRFILCVQPNDAAKVQLKRHIETCFAGEFEYRYEDGGENALRWLDKIILEGRDVAMIFVEQNLPDGRGDAFLQKFFKKRPNSLLILFAETDDNVQETALEAAKVYRLIYRPVTDPELKNALQEALRHYRQRIELTEKSRILTELNRASLSLIGEINLQKLLHKLMRIMIDNANAANAFIILEGENGPSIEAEGHGGRYETKFESQDITDFSPVCPAIVEYCRTTKETVVLGDAANEGVFSAHPYIRKNGCRSILCAPLVYQGILFGLLYLDNPEKTHAFNVHNLELFRLLSAPAAIAIQNAKLYAELERKVEERTREVNEQKAEITRQRDLIKQKNDDIIASIQYARRIQDAFLPKNHEIKNAFPQSFVYYKPKDVVSGDFYWFSQRLSKVIIAAADCTGHGIPGAFMTVMANTLLRQIVELEGLFKPEEILLQLHIRVRVALQQENPQEGGNKDGLDMALCQIDIHRKKMLFAGANRPLVLIRGGEVVEFKPDRHGVGGVQYEQSREFTCHSIDLLEGDVIYLFSDGYPDQIGEEINKRFLSRRFYTLLQEIHHYELDRQRLLLDAEFRRWRGDVEQTDDILVIGLKIG